MGGGGRFREMGICLDVRSEIDQCLINDNSLGKISISEVLIALGSEPEESKNTEYFNALKGL